VRRDKDENQTKECILCLDKPVSHIILPCMHFSLCEDCAKGYKRGESTCPVCRAPVTDVRKVFR